MNIIISQMPDEDLDSYINKEEILSSYQESLKEF